MDSKTIIDGLLKAGAKRVNNLIVRNVTVTPQEQYVRVCLTVDKEIECNIQNPETSKWELAKTNNVFTSSYSIGSLLKNDDNAAFAANHLINNPTGFNVILSRAEIDIIQETVPAGIEYVNPFSSNAEPRPAKDHDYIVNHVVRIKLSDFGVKRLDKLADKMLGFE